MSPEPIQVEFTTEGIEQVTAAFAKVSENSRQMSESVQRNAKHMSTSLREVATDLHVLTGGAREVLDLSNAFGVLTDEQTKAMNVMLQGADIAAGLITVVQMLTASEWALTIAKKARAIASAIVIAVESWGIAVPIIIAAATAGAVGVAAAFTSLPSRQFGGPVEETGPYMLHKGEFVVSEEGMPILRWTAPFIARSKTPAPTPFTQNITINYPTFRKRSDIDYLADRLRRMGEG